MGKETLIKVVDDRIHFLETELDDLRTQSDKLREAGVQKMREWGDW